MKSAFAAPLALALAAPFVSTADALDDPIKWNIQARILGVNGTPPEGALSEIGFDWNLNFSATVAGVTPDPDDMIPGGEFQQSLTLINDFTVEFEAPGDLDGYLLVGTGGNIDGAYLPRNFDNQDSADYTFADLPITQDRGEPVQTFTLVFGFFGPDGLLAGDDDFIAMPDLSTVSGTGFFVEFDNGAFAFGELIAWESIIVPAPGAASLLGLAALTLPRRRS